MDYIALAVLAFALFHMLHVSRGAKVTTSAILAMLDEERDQHRKDLEASYRRENDLREQLALLLSAVQDSKVGKKPKLETNRVAQVKKTIASNGLVLVEEKD